MSNKIELNNGIVSVRIDAEGIFAKDLTDTYNEQSLFTKSKRNVKKAQKEIVLGFDDTFNFSRIIDIISGNGIKYHSYCAID